MQIKFRRITHPLKLRKKHDDKEITDAIPIKNNCPLKSSRNLSTYCQHLDCLISIILRKTIPSYIYVAFVSVGGN